MSNPLWQYSTSHYSREGVAEICLALQDRHDLDVNVLLYAAWLATCGCTLEPGHLQALEGEISRWRQEVVLPLRTLRRRWKGCDSAEELRNQLKELELQAERTQQELMLAFCRANPPVRGSSASVEANLCLVAESMAKGGLEWRPGIEKLSRLLSD